MTDLSLPSIVLLRWFFAAVLFSMLFFHVAFIRIWPLGKTAWKRIDYLWISCGVLGLVGNLFTGRQLVATQMLSIANSRVENESRLVLDRIQSGTSAAVCRTFVRTEYSPAPDQLAQLQREYDALCAWFKAVAERTPPELSKRHALSLEALGDGPPPSGGDQFFVQSAADEIRQYNVTLAAADNLEQATKRSELETTFAIVGPFLLAFALGLRLTKVTAEIRLDRR
jgi:hypothetical protein